MAVKCFNVAIDIDYGYAKAHFNLGLAFQRRKFLDGAQSCFEKVLEINPQDTKTNYLLGVILMKDEEEFDRAIECFNRALEGDPGNEKARLKLGELLAIKSDKGIVTPF